MRIADKIVAIIPSVADRLSKLSKAEFENILHSLFKEDKMTLILLGAFLRVLFGLAQAILVINTSQLPSFLR
ncbi:MAG: hypothetical protein N3A69_08350 [Leptospiraceae bacterium]|nr:hypothetical protein [Leptospiraceae bacterium]